MAESMRRNLSKAGLTAGALLNHPARSVLIATLLLAPGALAGDRAVEPALPLAEESAPAPAPASVEVIFTGFARRVDKGASIFVRMTGEVPVAVEQSGRRFIYRLSGAKLGVRNNANPLPTGQFGPPVSNVALVAGNGSVDVVVDLTTDPGDKAPVFRVVSQSRLATLVIELPPPSE
jgi:hypothetical protein